MKAISICFLFMLILNKGFSQAASKTNSAKDNKGLQVRLTTGRVEGVMEASGIRSFKGIPFAAPPVGDLRWKEPQPVKAWSGVLKADHFGPRAMQTPIFGDMNFRSDGVSEDCLYLNIWAPAKKGKNLLPVLVYFYGGGFVAGDGSEPRYDGESMARKGIVALTVNYRLGLFGFFSHPELSAESSYKSSGNYGLLDQAAALHWVQQNISAFGGDPKRVTIAGESAGSISVSALMVSPLSKNLFAGAIGESGSILGALPPLSLKDGEETGKQFAKSIGALSLAELRAIPADSLLSASARFGLFRFARTLDGYFFPKEPYQIFSNGEQSKVPLLVGWNNEEANYRAIIGNEKPTREVFLNAIKKLYGEKADEVLRLYHPATDEEVERVATDLAGDRFIALSTWRWADIHGKTGGRPVYRYLYEHPRPGMRPEMGNATPGLAGGIQKGAGTPQPRPKGAVHSAEIEYAMGNLATNNVFAWTGDDYKVSRILQGYFANFIKKGHPNGAGLPQWQAANRSKEVPVMHINVKSELKPEENRERYLLMERLVK